MCTRERDMHTHVDRAHISPSFEFTMDGILDFSSFFGCIFRP